MELILDTVGTSAFDTFSSWISTFDTKVFRLPLGLLWTTQRKPYNTS